MTPDFIPAYHRARTLVIVCVGLILLWEFGVTFDGPLPLLGVRVRQTAAIPYIIACVLAYSVVRLLIEWVQSDVDRRRRLVSRIDLTVTLTLAAAASWLILSKLISFFELPPFSLILSGIALMTLGYNVGLTGYICFENLFLIRSKKEAQQLALPRFPVAVRASFRFSYYTIPPLIIVIIVAPHFELPLASLWPWLLFVPASLVFVAGVISILVPSGGRSDGTRVSRSEHIKRLRKIFDKHDARYQVGGWDERVPPNNTPLYDAAKRGDTAEVRRLLEEGADPDEPNEHGWTALMIAVAQSEEETARLLLAKGADPKIDNLLDRNALMYASRYGNVELVRVLIQHGAPVNVADSTDPYALAIAAQQGHTDLVQLLLEAGADPTICDFSGKTAQDYAQAAGHGEIAAALRGARLRPPSVST